MNKNSYIEYIIYELYQYDLTFTNFVEIVGNYYPNTTFTQKIKLCFTTLEKLLQSNLLLVESMDSTETVYSTDEANKILQKVNDEILRKCTLDSTKDRFNSLFEIPYAVTGKEAFSKVYEKMVEESDWGKVFDENDDYFINMPFQQMMNYEHGKLKLYLGQSDK